MDVLFSFGSELSVSVAGEEFMMNIDLSSWIIMVELMGQLDPVHRNRSLSEELPSVFEFHRHIFLDWNVGQAIEVFYVGSLEEDDVAKVDEAIER